MAHNNIQIIDNYDLRKYIVDKYIKTTFNVDSKVAAGKAVSEEEISRCKHARQRLKEFMAAGVFTQKYLEMACDQLSKKAADRMSQTYTDASKQNAEWNYQFDPQTILMEEEIRLLLDGLIAWYRWDSDWQVIYGQFDSEPRKTLGSIKRLEEAGLCSHEYIVERFREVRSEIDADWVAEQGKVVLDLKSALASLGVRPEEHIVKFTGMGVEQGYVVTTLDFGLDERGAEADYSSPLEHLNEWYRCTVRSPGETIYFAVYSATAPGQLRMITAEVTNHVATPLRLTTVENLGAVDTFEVAASLVHAWLVDKGLSFNPQPLVVERKPSAPGVDVSDRMAPLPPPAPQFG